LSRDDKSKAHVLEFERSVKKKKPASKIAKLQKSSWYEGAARSVGINKERPPKKLKR
jgi:hypothetical protein